MKYCVLLFVLSGCTAPAMLGLGAASTATVATTGSSPTDIVLSRARDQDCQTLRWFQNRQVCQDIVPDNVGIAGMEHVLARRQFDSK